MHDSFTKKNTMKNIIKLGMAAAILCGATALQAASVTIDNHSFENGGGLPAAPPATTWNNNVPDGWQKTGGVGMQNISADATTGTDGEIVVFLQTGAISQNITASILGNAVAAGDLFTLTLAATNQNGSPTFDFDIQDGFGGSLIGGPVTSAPNSPANPTYADAVVVGTVDTASADVVLVLSNSAGQTRIDNVRLDLVQVPEPSSSALLGLAGMALIFRRRK